MKAFLLPDRLRSIDPRLIWIWMESHGRYGAFFRVPGSPSKEWVQRGVPFKLYPRCLWFAAPRMDPTDDDYRVLRESFYKWHRMTGPQIAEAEAHQQIVEEAAERERHREAIDPLVEDSLRQHDITKQKLGSIIVPVHTAANEPRGA